jgi:hypothetical protein
MRHQIIYNINQDNFLHKKVKVIFKSRSKLKIQVMSKILDPNEGSFHNALISSVSKS